jgi:hypothetical protein
MKAAPNNAFAAGPHEEEIIAPAQRRIAGLEAAPLPGFQASSQSVK